MGATGRAGTGYLSGAPEFNGITVYISARLVEQGGFVCSIGVFTHMIYS
jgi:hypothetical protein